jgi:outer membrane lipoprotein-sorting protein
MNTNLHGRRTVMMGLCLAMLCTAGTRQAEVLLPDAECRAFIKQMAQSAQAHNALKARFLQERRLALFDDVLKMKGYFYYRKPGRIRWEFIDPYASIMLLLEDGRTERFEIIGGRAVKARTDDRQISGEALSQILRWLKGDLEPATKDFDVQLYRGATARLVLRPKSESLAAFLSKIEFEIDSRSYVVLAISLWEGENDVTVIRFLDLDVNPLLPDGLFDADAPRLLTEGER